MEYRADAGTFGNVRETRQGGIIVPANLTRTGVFVYDYADGTRVRELRHPDEVFKSDSLDTLAHAPLVVGHPAEINPDNYRQLNVGHVETPKQDGKFVAANVRVQDRDTIRRVKSDGPDKLVEVSCGYRCNVVPESGVYNGERYDARQTDIVYNHVGMGPKDWGRAGNEVKLRLDSGDPAVVWLQGSEVRTDSAQEMEKGEPLLPSVEPVSKPVEAPKPAESRADGIEALQGQVAFLKSEIERIKADSDAKIAQLSKDLVAANAPERLDGLVAERVAKDVARKALVASVSPILGAEFKADGKTDHELRTAALAKLRPAFKLDGKSEGEIAGAFAMALESDASATAALGGLQNASPTAPRAPHADGKPAAERDAFADARAEQRYRSENAWRGDSWLRENPWKP